MQARTRRRRQNQIAFLDVFDRVPTDPEVLGNILNGHVPRKVIAFKGVRVMLARVGERDPDLSDVPAGYSGDQQADEDRFASYGDGTELANNGALDPHVGIAAGGTTNAFTRLVDLLLKLLTFSTWRTCTRERKPDSITARTNVAKTGRNFNMVGLWSPKRF
jgi:hypothetical protein